MIGLAVRKPTLKDKVLGVLADEKTLVALAAGIWVCNIILFKGGDDIIWGKRDTLCARIVLNTVVRVATLL